MKRSILYFLMFSPLPAMADDVRPFTLGEILVTADKLGASGLGSTSVDSKTMRRFDSVTVGQALNLLSGVNISNVGARNEQMVYVRGFDLRQVPLFVDGIPVYVPYDGYVDLGRFDTFDLSRIDLSKGFSSSLYGSNTLGGAINMVSRRPQKAFEGEAGGGLSFTDRTENNGYRAYANIGTNQGQWYFQGSASEVHEDYYRLPGGFSNSVAQGPGLRNNSYQKDHKVNLKLGYTPNAQDEYAINYINQHGVKGVPPYAGAVAGVAPRYWRWPYWDKESLYFIGDKAFGDGNALKVRAYYDRFSNSLFTYDNATYTTQLRPFAFKSWYDDFTTGTSIETDLRLSASNQLKLAYNFKNDVHREHNAGQPIRYFQDHTQSLAMDDSHELRPGMSLVTGLSYEKRDTLKAQDYVANKVVPFAMANASDWNGQAGIAYKTGDTGKITAFVAAKSRFPTIKDRYSYRLGTAIPNAGLRPERAWNYEVDYSDVLAGRASFEVAFFHSDISDMIQSVTIAPTLCTTAPCTQMQNVGKVSMDGFEANLKAALPHDWEAGGNYTYLDRVNKSNPTIFLMDTPKHKVSAFANGPIGGGFSLTGGVDAMSYRYSSSTGTQVASGFMVANLKLAYRVSKSTVSFGVQNLFDRLYAYSEGFPEPGRTYLVQFDTGF
ncbi:MAG: TonB-dependent receptor [Burkholderiales bacterium]|nr:TonB-dependent receptor [Burkholderiales bacterium]